MTEEIIENRLVYCKDAQTRAEESSRIITTYDPKMVYDEDVTITPAIQGAKTVQALADVLHSCSSCDIHIIGSRGRAYHTGKLAEFLEDPHCAAAIPFVSQAFPRTFGLRARVVELFGG